MYTRGPFSCAIPSKTPFDAALRSMMNQTLRKMLAQLFISCLLLSVSFLSHTVWALSGKPHLPEKPIGLRPLTDHQFSKPIFLTTAPGQSNRLFIVEQDGKIFFLDQNQQQPRLFLDVSGKLSTGGERGLLGLAFHPQFARNGRFFLNYTRIEDRATVLAEYRMSSDPDMPSEEESIVLVVPQPYGNHNGGMITFGPDGYLYLGMGDGGAGGDPENRAQNVEELLGKFLRIDVDGDSPYGIPPDNPFVAAKGKPEIYALGVRNPWRFSFDRKTGELWAGDVGQNMWEEIHVIKKGQNLGWRLMEGTHCFNPSKDCQTIPGLTLPKTEYAHEKGRCSVTGGYVYRGTNIPALDGTYLFGDFCTGEIWGFKKGQTQLLFDTDLKISSFGEDGEGEVFVVGYEGKIFTLVPTEKASEERARPIVFQQN